MSEKLNVINAGMRFKVHLVPIKAGYLKDHMGNLVVADGIPEVIDGMGQAWSSVFTKEYYEVLRKKNPWLPPFRPEDDRFEIFNEELEDDTPVFVDNRGDTENE